MSTTLENLNQEQLRAVTHGEGPLLIVAGAGTGKTHVITKRIIWLIENNKANTDEILALTFTDKAAGEMEDRVTKDLPYGYVDLWISTFHSFCDRILRDYALDIGLPTNYKLLNTTEQWMLVKKNLDRFNLDYYKPFGNPTKFIHALLKHFSRCKDEGITTEAYLEYVESLRLNQDTAESGIKATRKSKVKGQKSKVASETDLEDLDAIKLLDIKKLEEVANAYHIYQQILLEKDAIDFGDLINYTLKLFRERPNVLAKIREKFKYILVDEFQDTNWAQYELIKLLAAPKNNITCVADDDQSIYLFRGSSVNNVLQFAKDYPKCEEVVLVENYRSSQEILDLSYKFIQANNPNRLEYHLNQDDVMRERAKEKGIDLADYKSINKKLHSNLGENAIIEHLHCATLEDEINAVVKKIIELKSSSQGVETQNFASLHQAENSNITWSDFAILVRANDSAKPFLHGLERAGIPYQFYSLRGLYNKPIILDITSYFKLLDNYHETAALYRVLNMPIWQIPHHDFSKLNYEAFRQGKSLYQIIKNAALINELSAGTIKSLEKIISLVEKHSKLAKEKSISELMELFLRESGYLDYLAKHETAENVKNFRYLNEFHKKIKEFETTEKAPRLKTFMESLEMEIDAGDEGNLGLDLDAGPDMVRIMTIHGAKGLEFSYVFIVDLVDKKFPTIERKDPIEIPERLVKEILPEGDIHLQEERRLFYVAMTRAKKGLFFSSAEDYGGARKKKISRFLSELGYEAKISASVETQNFASFPRDTEEQKSAKENIYILPKQFSYTQLAAFKKCPLQYKFAHILRIPIKGKGTFSFGKTMHSTLQKFFALVNERKSNTQGGLFDNLFGATGSGQGPQPPQVQPTQVQHAGRSTQPETIQAGTVQKTPQTVSFPNNFPTLQDLLKLYEESWIDEWYENDKEREEKKNEGRKALEEFYARHKDNWPEVLFLEKGFNLRVGEYTLKGNIDRVDLLVQDGQKNKVELVDYKTGAAKDEKSIEKDQLLIYQMAAEECLKLTPEKLTFYYIEGNKPVSFLGTKEDLDKMKEEIISQIEEIKKSKFPAKPENHTCKFCDFNSICEYRK